ncbi:MAG: hypothetical protein OEP95_13745, partial [Myxococcales bacterium]|nr:hypothetical protein [Myxococcales bacterium]
VVATRDATAVLAAAEEAAIPAREIGRTGGESLRVVGPDDRTWLDLPLERLAQARDAGIPRRLAAGESDE